MANVIWSAIHAYLLICNTFIYLSVYIQNNSTCHKKCLHLRVEHPQETLGCALQMECSRTANKMQSAQFLSLIGGYTLWQEHYLSCHNTHTPRCAPHASLKRVESLALRSIGALVMRQAAKIYATPIYRIYIQSKLGNTRLAQAELDEFGNTLT